MKYRLLVALVCVGVWPLPVQGAELRLLEASRSGRAAELQGLLAAGWKLISLSRDSPS